MFHLKMKETVGGAKAGDVIRFEDREEALALVAAGKADEVRMIDGEWTVVKRHEEVVKDDIGLAGGEG